MKRHHPHWLAVLTAAILLTMSASASCRAESRTSQRASIDETFEAGAAELIGVAGRVYVLLHDGHGIRLRAEGPKRWISDLVRRMEAGVLVVNGGSLDDGSPVETSVGSRNVKPDGGVASGGAAEDPPEIELFVPVGTPLTATAASGRWEIAPLKASLALEVVGAEVSAGAMTDARLSVRGGGDIKVAEVEGDLYADIAGSGSITVLSGVVNNLKAGVAGTGSVLVQAPAERADLAVSGDGSIEVLKVLREPKVRISGLGTVRTGYRP
jgi:hypothetical protein